MISNITRSKKECQLTIFRDINKIAEKNNNAAKVSYLMKKYDISEEDASILVYRWYSWRYYSSDVINTEEQNNE